MSQDLVINGVAYNGVESLSIPTASGGTAVFSEGGGASSPAPSASPKDVNFYDCDGARLYSWTLAELASATALPALPSRGGLVCQGWNWTLAQLQALGRAAEVGAIYTTDDGSTRLCISIAAEGRRTVPLYIQQTVANGVSIDWGDGSAAETLSGTGSVNTMHTYAQMGDYCIAMTVADGCTLGLGNGTSGYCVLGPTGDSGKVYCSMLKRVELGSGMTSIGNYAFYYCYCLASVSIPSGVTSIGQYAFDYCYSLTSVSFPSGLTTLGNSGFLDCYSLSHVSIPPTVTGFTGLGAYCFSSCYSLAAITIPDGVTQIQTSVFVRCSSLASVVIPSGVTSVKGMAFQYDSGVAVYDFSACTAVPTLSNVSAFSGIQSDCVMRIPAALFATWSAATNWSTYAGNMVAV